MTAPRILCEGDQVRCRNRAGVFWLAAIHPVRGEATIVARVNKQRVEITVPTDDLEPVKEPA